MIACAQEPRKPSMTSITRDLPPLPDRASDAQAGGAQGWDMEDAQTAWQMRRAQIGDVTRYTRFVTVMKVVLPAAATLLLALVIIYSVIGRSNDNVTVSMTALESLENDKQMVKPRLTGNDGKGRAFTVTASAVGQELGASPDKSAMTLFDVESDVTMENKSWTKIEAKRGVLDGKAKKLTLTGAINIFSDMGYECHTDAATYDIAKGVLSGQRPITCQGPLGVIQGNGFEGLRKAELMKLTGGVKTQFFPPRREPKPAQSPAESVSP
jgi:lipopolysaccharide export system protein LptC